MQKKKDPIFFATPEDGCARSIDYTAYAQGERRQYINQQTTHMPNPLVTHTHVTHTNMHR